MRRPGGAGAAPADAKEATMTNMRVFIVTLGSRGDVQPYVALGKELKQRGHDVTIGTHTNFAEFITAEGLSHANVGDDVTESIQSPESKDWMESGSDPIKFVRGFRQIMERYINTVSVETLQATEGTDLIIGSGTGLYSGFASAQVRNVPFVQAYLQPIHPTGAFPSPLLPLPFPIGGLFNYATHLVGGQLFWQAVRSVVNDVRRDVFQLPPVHPIIGPFFELDNAQGLVLYGYSEAVLPRPKNWAPWVNITGYWFLNQDEWAPSRELADFLDAGPPPVVIGFGSMSDRSPEKMTDVVLGALKESRQRGILLTGWGGLSQADLSDDVLLLKEAPHAWLFPKASAIVHHGGAGTSSAGFRSGKPAVFVPFMADQPFWANRAEQLGVAPPPLPRKELSADALGERLAIALSDDAVRAQSHKLGEAIQAERGATKAAELIEQYVKKFKGWTKR